MVNQAGQDFQHLIPNRKDDESPADFKLHVMMATLGHDLIEDTRESYNDVKQVLGEETADIIYACTNEKGKTRAERAGIKYYDGIRNTPGAVFVKLCDRIANVQYSKLTKSRMFEMYKNENANFEIMLGRYTDNKNLEEMFKYLSELFDN
jgi:(p)ppGpp synthase/HD superfamily hydrolase